MKKKLVSRFRKKKENKKSHVCFLFLKLSQNFDWFKNLNQSKAKRTNRAKRFGEIIGGIEKFDCFSRKKLGFVSKKKKMSINSPDFYFFIFFFQSIINNQL